MNLFVLLIAYLVGSLPSGYWYAKYLFGVDVTTKGSRNIGATNVARVLGSKKHFVIVWFFDASKAFLTLSILRLWGGISPGYLILCAGALLLGNGCSVFLNFRGGKGVATLTGILFALFPQYGAAFVLSVTLFALLFRRVDAAVLASLFLVTGASFYPGWMPTPYLQMFFLFAMFWLFFLHRDNIRFLKQSFKN